jgi:hypothetical protein
MIWIIALACITPTVAAVLTYRYAVPQGSFPWLWALLMGIIARRSAARVSDAD